MISTEFATVDFGMCGCTVWKQIFRSGMESIKRPPAPLNIDTARTQNANHVEVFAATFESL